MSRNWKAIKTKYSTLDGSSANVFIPNWLRFATAKLGAWNLLRTFLPFLSERAMHQMHHRSEIILAKITSSRLDAPEKIPHLGNWKTRARNLKKEKKIEIKYKSRIIFSGSRGASISFYRIFFPLRYKRVVDRARLYAIIADETASCKEMKSEGETEKRNFWNNK